MFNSLMKYKDILKHLFPKALRPRVKDMLFFHWVASVRRSPAPGGGLPWGVNVYGLINDPCGIAQASRGNLLGFEKAGVPVKTFDCRSLTGDEDSGYAVNYIHLNPDLLRELAAKTSEEFWREHYNIGYWVWEQEKLPREWIKCGKLFDELWTASEFSAGAIRKGVSVPTYVIPHIVAPECDEEWDRRRWGLPEELFLVLIAFDCESVPERKNPLGAVRAFLRAFGPEEPVGLVIKARNMTPAVEQDILTELGDRKNVFLLTGDYPKNAVNSLIRACDVYLSLHRGEGFGLVMAEAMYLGTPVVATDWSGNRDFMDSDTACMVKSTAVRLKKSYPPFKKGSRWAQPDEEQAAGYLRALYDDRELYKKIAANAAARVREELSADAVSARIRERTDKIKESLRKATRP